MYILYLWRINSLIYYIFGWATLVHFCTFKFLGSFLSDLYEEESAKQGHGDRLGHGGQRLDQQSFSLKKVKIL